jgi:hypothetical protein
MFAANNQFAFVAIPYSNEPVMVRLGACHPTMAAAGA